MSYVLNKKKKKGNLFGSFLSVFPGSIKHIALVINSSRIFLGSQ